MSFKNTKKPWAGVDLAASARGISAIAWGSHPTNVQVAEVRTDEELLLRLSGVGAVWVDAPLTQGEGPFRACDRALHGCGLSIMPLTWPSMQKLLQRAQRLCASLPHIPWYETFPWAVYKSWGLSRKDLSAVQQKLREADFAVVGDSMHACDALAAWWLGWLHRQEAAYPLSGPDGTLWVPRTLLAS